VIARDARRPRGGNPARRHPSPAGRARSDRSPTRLRKEYHVPPKTVRVSKGRRQIAAVAPISILGPQNSRTPARQGFAPQAPLRALDAPSRTKVHVQKYRNENTRTNFLQIGVTKCHRTYFRTAKIHSQDANNSTCSIRETKSNPQSRLPQGLSQVVGRGKRRYERRYMRRYEWRYKRR